MTGQQQGEAEITERTVVVTGGGSGLGREIARPLPAQGARVVVTDFNHLAARAGVAFLRSRGG